MNRCEQTEQVLGDHLDSRLPPDELRNVEHHLSECAACRGARDGLVALQARVAELPRDLEPVRDLWPKISAQIATRPNGGRRGLRFPWRAIAVAASVLIAIGAVALVKQMSSSNDAAMDVAANHGGTTDNSVRLEVAKAEAAYAAAANGFLAQFKSTESSLTPDARQLLEGNLDITNQAISDIKSAFEARPNDFELARKLLVAHEQRLELLQNVTQFSQSNRNGG